MEHMKKRVPSSKNSTKKDFIYDRIAISPFMIKFFWHETCFFSTQHTDITIMNKRMKQYQITKENAKVYLENGQLSAYLKALIKINAYQRMIVSN